jgi:TRAP transporter TAXI family solute receptor
MQFGLVAYDAMWFKQLSEATKMSKIKVVMPLNMNTIHLIARADSGINSIGDLNGKRTNVGPPGSGSFISSTIIRLKTNTKWNESTLSNKDALIALRAGRIDALFYFSAMPVRELVELGKEMEGVIKLVNMKHPSLDGFYILAEVPDNMYPWQTKSVFQYSVKNLLITYNYTTPGKMQAVTDLTTCIIDALPKLQESGHSGWREVEPKSYTEVKWSMHPSAKAVIDGR